MLIRAVRVNVNFVVCTRILTCVHNTYIITTVIKIIRDTLKELFTASLKTPKHNDIIFIIRAMAKLSKELFVASEP